MSIDKNFILGYGAGKASKTEQTIIDTTEAWLDEHIDPDTGYVIDNSLSVAGAAADAKATGDAIAEQETKIGDVKADVNKLKPIYGKSHPTKALFPEFISDFWCSSLLPSALIDKQAEFTVSGDVGDTLLTVSGIEPDTISLSDLGTNWTGGVMTSDGVSYDVYNFRYSAPNTIEIYPPLKSDVEDAILANYMLDSTVSSPGMHLTEHGFKAYAYNLYNKNPKHCEKGLYNAKYDSRTDTSHPFSRIIPTTQGNLYIGASTENLNYRWLSHYFTKRLSASFMTSYTAYNQKNGVKWEVDLHGTSGYLELFVASIHTGSIKIPEGQEIYVDVTIDGELASQTIIDDWIGRKICVDYENAQTGKLEIYCNKWAPINNGASGIKISKATWWINELEYEDNKLFPVGSVVAQEFDSWGGYNDGVVGKTIDALISEDAGVTVPYYNSAGYGQTTAWGMAYWYENVKEHNPSIAITDFLINDANSVDSTSIPDTITGPDGKEYNNKITQEMYAVNIKKLCDFSISNDIQPIIMQGAINARTSSVNFMDAAIEAQSVQYGS